MCSPVKNSCIARSAYYALCLLQEVMSPWNSQPTLWPGLSHSCRISFRRYRPRRPVVAACSVGVDVAKQWLFASSFAPIKAMAATCAHQGQHASVIGTRDAQGNFLSQRTAEYPTALAVHYSKLVSSLFGGYIIHDQTTFCSLSVALQCIPRKGRSSPPFGAQNGGGIYIGPRY